MFEYVCVRNLEHKILGNVQTLKHKRNIPSLILPWDLICFAEGESPCLTPWTKPKQEAQKEICTCFIEENTWTRLWKRQLIAYFDILIVHHQHFSLGACTTEESTGKFVNFVKFTCVIMLLRILRWLSLNRGTFCIILKMIILGNFFIYVPHVCHHTFWVSQCDCPWKKTHFRIFGRKLFFGEFFTYVPHGRIIK